MFLKVKLLLYYCTSLITVSKVDNIIAIDKGEIVEEGNHLTYCKKRFVFIQWDKQKRLKLN